MATRRKQDDDVGPNTRSVVALVHSMGQLSPREQVAATAALTLAAALDADPDPAKMAALSRELRQTVHTLLRTGGATGGDKVGGLADEVARKRAQRRAGA